jgi:tRNA(Ile)-lysidine synthetase-like protein
MPNTQLRQPYPKPGKLGGRLIREVIGFLKSQNVELPIASHILIATSGGIDSVGLAHLLVHFGRRIAPKSQISLLHVNHGWRGQDSDDDAQFVEDLGKQWGVPVITKRIQPPAQDSQSSWEEEARNARKKIYSREGKRLNAIVLTAHHADDLAETVLWRLFTGAAQTHGGGVAFRHGIEMRPFLRVRKSEIQAYLKEVGETHREDATNFSNRFMRSRMRSHLMPELEKLFPRAIEHLTALALDAQGRVHVAGSQTQGSDQSPFEPHEVLFKASGLKARRPHLELILEKLVAKKPWYGEIHLPGGWRLVREKGQHPKHEAKASTRFQPSAGPPFERWILERI